MRAASLAGLVVGFRRLGSLLDLVPYASARELAALLGRGALLVDVGGGTGRVAATLRGAFARVVVADVERALLARARAKGLEVVLADAARLPFRRGVADGVVAVDAFHHFREQAASAREMTALLAPGGRLVLHEFDPGTLAGRAVELGERALRFGSRFWRPDDLRDLVARESGVRPEVAPLGVGQYALRATRPKA